MVSQKEQSSSSSLYSCEDCDWGCAEGEISDLKDHPLYTASDDTGTCSRFVLRWPSAFSGAIEALADREGIAVQTVLQSAWAVLVSRYTGESTVVFGASNGGMHNGAGRNQFRSIRVCVDSAQTVADLFRAVHASWLEPVELRQTHRNTDDDNRPLIGVLLRNSLLNHEHCLLSVDAVLSSGFAVVVSAWLSTNPRVEFDYDLSRISSEMVEGIARHFQQLLMGLAERSSVFVCDLPLLSCAEASRQLTEWNATGVDYATNQSISELFERQAAVTPKSVAVIFEDNQLSYRELNEKSNQLAHHLREMGVGPEVPVGLCMERSLELVVALLGVLKAGGFYVPLDPEYPTSRLEFMIREAGVRLLMTQLDQRLRFQSKGLTVICPDDGQIAQKPSHNLPNQVTDQNAVYLIYTSGSTGRPKGTVNLHAAIRNRLLWMQGAYHLQATDRVLQKTPFSFDVSVWEFLWPLLNGASLVLARPGGHRDVAYLVDLIEHAEITTIHFVPSLLQYFVQEPNLRRRCRSLRLVISSGEALPLVVQNRFLERLDVRLENLYGPTEAAVDVTAWRCVKSAGQDLVPIGRPIANTQMYVLDEAMNPVPAGMPGELYIGGIQLARGYVQRPELTAGRFVPDPFSIEPGLRLYRTGDLGRWRTDGNIEFLGRIDHQVKIRGFRVELGEIEALLQARPEIQQAVVVFRRDGGVEHLVAYLVGLDAPSPDELRRYLQNALPEYMMPSVFVHVPALPLTSSGKVDRAKLPPPNIVASQQICPPSEEPIQRVLARIWAEVLGAENLGPDDNFFHLGGDSLKITQMTSRVRSQLGCELQFAAVFRSPTLRTLGAVLADSCQNGSRPTERTPSLKIAGNLDAERRDSPDEPTERRSGSGDKGIPAEHDWTQYQLGDVEAFRVDDGNYWIYSWDSGSSKIVSGTVWSRLRSAAVPGVDGRLGATEGEIDGPALDAVLLADLEYEGFLTSRPAAIAKLQQRYAASLDPGKITTAGCITHNRSESLLHSLASYIRHAATFGRNPTFVVIDSSDHAQNREQQHDRLRNLQAKSQSKLCYAGPAEKMRFIRNLSKSSGVPPDVAEFALLGWPGSGIATPGANRNCLFLQTIGELALSFDDDIFCELKAPPAVGKDIQIVSKGASSYQPENVWAFESRAESKAFLRSTNADLFAKHEKMLGNDAFVPASNDALLYIQAATPRLLRQLTDGRKRIRLSVNGVAGDCGWGSPLPFLYLNGASFERLTRSEDAYRATLTRREIVRTPTSTVVTDAVEDFMAGIFGFNHQALFPPFSPLGRGEDRVFGVTLSACFEDTCLGYQPLTVAHEPADVRAFWPGEVFRSAGGFDVSSLLSMLIKSFDFSSQPDRGAIRLRNLGSYLETVGNLGLDDFEKFIRFQVWKDFSDLIIRLETRIQQEGSSRAFWTTDMRRYLALRREHLAKPQGCIPLDLVGGQDLSWAQQASRRLVRDFGRLLFYWPDIVDASAQLRKAGTMIASHIQ